MHSALLTRRSFAVAVSALAPAFGQQQSKGKKRAALPPPLLGVCTTSFALKDASADKLLAAVNASKLRVVALGAPHFDPWHGADSGVARMRDLRAKFAAAGVLIRSVSVEIADSRTDAEISRMLAMANALDVRHVAAEAPVAMLGRLNQLARQHAVIVALRNTPELKSVTDMQNAVHSFGSLGLAPDIGKLESAGASDPVDLLRHNAGRVFELRFRAGSPKVAETLQIARYQHPAIPLLIDVTSPADVEPSLTFFRDAVRHKPAEQQRGQPGSGGAQKKG